MREVLSVTSVSVTVTPPITAPCGSEAVPTIVPLLVFWPKAGAAFKNTIAKAMVITTVNASKHEIARVMWSPSKCF